MQDYNSILRELLKLVQLPTPNEEHLKEIVISFDEAAEKISHLSPELRTESVILLAKALYKYGIIK